MRSRRRRRAAPGPRWRLPSCRPRFVRLRSRHPQSCPWRATSGAPRPQVARAARRRLPRSSRPSSSCARASAAVCSCSSKSRSSTSVLRRSATCTGCCEPSPTAATRCCTRRTHRRSSTSGGSRSSRSSSISGRRAPPSSSLIHCRPTIPVVVRVCVAARIPFIVVHDRDAGEGRQPIAAERAVNREILAAAGRQRVVELVPDFEAVAGLRGHAHKPEHAWRRFADVSAARVPAPLAEAVARVRATAR